MKRMTDLAAHLDSIDEALLAYVDDEGHLRVPAARRVVRFAEAALEGSVTPSQLERDWPEWFALTEAFVAACSFDDLEEVARASAIGKGQQVPELTEADRRYLEHLIVVLDTYAAARDAGEDF